MPNERSIDVETLLSHAHRAKDLLSGARALLTGTTQPMAPTACNVVLEARAELASIIDALESLAAVQAEAHRAMLAKHVTMPEVRR